MLVTTQEALISEELDVLEELIESISKQKEESKEQIFQDIGFVPEEFRNWVSTRYNQDGNIIPINSKDKNNLILEIDFNSIYHTLEEVEKTLRDYSDDPKHKSYPELLATMKSDEFDFSAIDEENSDINERLPEKLKISKYIAIKYAERRLRKDGINTDDINYERMLETEANKIYSYYMRAMKLSGVAFITGSIIIAGVGTDNILKIIDDEHKDTIYLKEISDNPKLIEALGEPLINDHVDLVNAKNMITTQESCNIYLENSMNTISVRYNLCRGTLTKYVMILADSEDIIRIQELTENDSNSSSYQNDKYSENNTKPEESVPLENIQIDIDTYIRYESEINEILGMQSAKSIIDADIREMDKTFDKNRELSSGNITSIHIVPMEEFNINDNENLKPIQTNYMKNTAITLDRDGNIKYDITKTNYLNIDTISDSQRHAFMEKMSERGYIVFQPQFDQDTGKIYDYEYKPTDKFIKLAENPIFMFNVVADIICDNIDYDHNESEKIDEIILLNEEIRQSGMNITEWGSKNPEKFEIYNNLKNETSRNDNLGVFTSNNGAVCADYSRLAYEYWYQIQEIGKQLNVEGHQNNLEYMGVFIQSSMAQNHGYTGIYYDVVDKEGNINRYMTHTDLTWADGDGHYDEDPNRIIENEKPINAVDVKHYLETNEKYREKNSNILKRAINALTGEYAM